MSDGRGLRPIVEDDARLMSQRHAARTVSTKRWWTTRRAPARRRTGAPRRDMAGTASRSSHRSTDRVGEAMHRDRGRVCHLARQPIRVTGRVPSGGRRATNARPAPNGPPEKPPRARRPRAVRLVGRRPIRTHVPRQTPTRARREFPRPERAITDHPQSGRPVPTVITARE